MRPKVLIFHHILVGMALILTHSACSGMNTPVTPGTDTDTGEKWVSAPWDLSADRHLVGM